MNIKNYYNILLIIIFLVALLLPSLGSFLGISSKIDNTERRQLAKFPELSLNELSEFSKKIEGYFRDHFGFRNFMIRAYSKIKLNYLNSTPNYEKAFRVIIGKNGWLFLNPAPGDNLKKFYNGSEFYSSPDFSQDQLVLIKNKLEEEKAWLAERGIPYFIVIVPDKEAVYPEYYPYPNHIITNRRLDQLMDYLSHNSDVEVLDLRNALISAKELFPTYYYTDTHWNNYGAFIAYQEIMKKLSTYYPDITIPKLSDFDITLENYHLWVGDLGSYLNLSGKYQDFEVKFKLTNPSLEKNKLSSVIIYGDSFAETRHYAPLDSFLAEFPELKPILPLLFKNSDTVGLDSNHLKPNGRIEDLVPIIKNNIPDKNTQDRLVKWLINNSVSDEYIVGLNYFLPFSFSKVIVADHLPLYYPQIELEKPQLVIHEFVERFIDLLTGQGHEGPI